MGQLVSAESFYRFPSNKNAYIEDSHFINASSRLFGVADGNSAAYSPKNPPLMYGREGWTGGAIAARTFSRVGLQDNIDSVEHFARTANLGIFREHRERDLDPLLGHDVGGASFAVCGLQNSKLNLIVAGDCFVVLKTRDGFKFWHGFDEAAFATEQEDNMAGYAVCLEQTKTTEKPNGDKGLAWDLYHPKYQAKRIRCANRNIGQGGYASLNGDPALQDCWVSDSVDLVSHDILWCLLGTDGMLHADFRLDDAEEFVKTYASGGLPAIIKWRDERDYLPHIGKGEYPEASAVVLKFE